MHLNKRTWVQLAVFIVVSMVFTGYMLFGYLNLPQMLFNSGHYTVTMRLAQSGGLYDRSNVTYQGTEVGHVESVDLTDSGVDVQLSLDKGVAIPSDLNAEVHSQSAIGEQYVALLPRNGEAPPLRDGDVIPEGRTSVPPSITGILDSTNTALQAIPKDNLKTVIDESATAFGGHGPELSRIVSGFTTLAIDARANLDSMTTLIDGSGPILDSQANTSDSIAAWAAKVASLTGRLRDHDSAVAGVLENGAGATAEAQQLIDRLKQGVPLLMANLVSISQIALTYRADLEQILVLVPQSLANAQAISAASLNTPPGPYKTGFLSFNLNLNLPPTCTTGYLPAQSRRSPAEIDYPDRPVEDLYCRVPQDSQLNVRGIRNIPCEAKPWKRAPTVQMCEGDDQYVPLNDGYNWKGDPNATLSGQDIPGPRPPIVAPLPDPPQTVPQVAPPPIAAAIYDPASGEYVGPDGKRYTQADLADSGQPTSWQDMLTRPGS
ncbi:MlaD family protein [Mycobacterium sp.]|uniref:MlaD family protein n=1 Tax=Mycobacterium sp. TaxID=1785 RepID=UPI002D99DE8B|nr:MlaD family protein [Mycobacterium sp.]